jgi:hypothetical protein
MKTREVTPDEIAELKLIVARQQEVISRLVRAGKRYEARQEREALYRVLNRLDLLCAKQNRPR